MNCPNCGDDMYACPKCGHSPEDHNNAGSEPKIPDFPPDMGFISSGQMCCYAKPNEGEEGEMNWGHRVCGCDYAPEGSTRYYT